MNEKNIADMIYNSLELTSMDECENIISRIATFEEAGLLTNDDGIILYLKDGSEFQITVIRRR